MADDTEQDILFRKILVAIDPSSHSRAALEAAASLAQVMEAEIHGLFVHDELWDKAGHTSFTLINEITGSIHPMESKSLEDQVSRLKRRLHRSLETISREKKIKHTWESAEGKVEDKILEAAEDSDLITIGRRGSSFPRKKKLGSSAKAIIRKSEKPVLILKKGLRIGSNICAVYDGSSNSQQALRLALSLAQRSERELIILVTDNHPDALDERDRELEVMLEQTEVPTSVKLLKHTTLQSFLQSVHALRAGMLVISREQPLVQDYLDPIIDHVGCPMLLMN